MSIPINYYCPPSVVHDHHLLSTAASQSLPAWAFRVETNSDARHLAKRSELSPPLKTPSWGPQNESRQGLIWPDRIAQGSLKMTLDTPSGPHHTSKQALIWPDRIAQGSLKMTLNTPWGPHRTSQQGLIWPEGLAQNLAEQSSEPRKRWSEVLAEQISRPPYTQSESQAEQTGEPHKRWSEILAEQTSRPPYTQGESMLEQTGKPRNPLWIELAPRSNHRAVRIPLIRPLGNEQPLRAPNTSQTAPIKAIPLDRTATPTLAQALARIHPVHGQKDQVLDRFLDALLRMSNDIPTHYGPARQNVALQGLLKTQVEGLNIAQTQRVLTHLRDGLGASARAIADDARQRLAQGPNDPAEQQYLSNLAQAEHLADSLFKTLNRKLKTTITELRASNTLAGKPSRLSVADDQALTRLAARQAAPAG